MFFRPSRPDQLSSQARLRQTTEGPLLETEDCFQPIPPSSYHDDLCIGLGQFYRINTRTTVSRYASKKFVLEDVIGLRVQGQFRFWIKENRWSYGRDHLGETIVLKSCTQVPCNPSRLKTGLQTTVQIIKRGVGIYDRNSRKVVLNSDTSRAHI